MGPFRVPIRPPVNRRPLATPRVISLGSIKPWLLLPQFLNLRTAPIAVKIPLLRKEPTPLELSHLRKMMRGYYLEEALPDDPTLQVKMAHAMWAQEVETRRCFTCNQPGHLQRDHWKYEEKNGIGPLQPKGPPQNKSAQERVKPKPPQPG